MRAPRPIWRLPPLRTCLPAEFKFTDVFCSWGDGPRRFPPCRSPNLYGLRGSLSFPKSQPSFAFSIPESIISKHFDFSAKPLKDPDEGAHLVQIT